MRQLFPSPFTDGYCCVVAGQGRAGAAYLVGNEPQAQAYVPKGLLWVHSGVQGVLSTQGVVTKHWSSE